jgi:hypothetical protein
VENRTRAGIVEIVVGTLMTVFFLFGLGIAWLVPVLIADPGKLLEMVRWLSAGEIVLLCFVAFLFFLGLFTIYRGVSILTGWRFRDAACGFYLGIRGIIKGSDREP